jgi:hypothetical protein
MKLNRFVVLAVIALLMVGAMGAIANQSFAMGSHNTASIQAHTSLAQPKLYDNKAKGPVIKIQTCAQDQAVGSEVISAAADTDNIDLQCGDQTAPDVQSASGPDVSGNGAQDSIGSSVDTGSNTDQQVGDQSGDQSSPDNSGQTP